MRYCWLFCWLICSPCLAQTAFTLQDFFSENEALAQKTTQYFEALSDQQRVAQMLMTSAGRLGKPTAHVKKMIAEQKVGGVILLNGSVTEFKQFVETFDSVQKASTMPVPLLYSADAEPSLINKKIKGTTPVSKTAQLKDEAAVKKAAYSIAGDLIEIGVHYNFAPVCDVSSNNEAIGNRSFGNDSQKITTLSQTFINVMQQYNIVATAKHFPGHGYVKGDTHLQLVFIDGELKEVPIYQPLIDSGVISIMVGHIAVKNNNDYNTDGLPATCSHKIVTKLLREKMNFKGIVITDAMNMGAASKIPQATFKAVKAGCDIILMPENETELINLVLKEMKKDAQFQAQIYTSVQKIIRLKICLGLLP